MISRRKMFNLLGLAGGAAIAPAIAGGVTLFDPGRRVTHLPNGGLLIEDQSFPSGISITNCSNMTIQNCYIQTAPEHTAIRFKY